MRQYLAGLFAAEITAGTLGDPPDQPFPYQAQQTVKDIQVGEWQQPVQHLGGRRIEQGVELFQDEPQQQPRQHRCQATDQPAGIA